MLRALYILVCVAALALFSAHGFLGFDPLTSSTVSKLPKEVRQSPRGYRSFIFIHSGYHGGK